MDSTLLIFLLIAAGLGAKIFKALREIQADEQAQQPDSDNSKPARREVILPEPWHTMTPPKEVLKPTDETSRRKERKKEKRQNATPAFENKEPMRVTSSMQSTPHNATAPESSPTAEDFTIHSAEEARRAIIWGEILQRKY